jgi:hypothetical protein
MKKTITTITLAIIMTFGATFANAGIIIGDKSAPACSGNEGIIIGDILELFGIIIGDKSAPCTTTDTDGIIIGD